MCAPSLLLAGMKEKERMPAITSNLGTRGVREKRALESLLADRAELMEELPNLGNKIALNSKLKLCNSCML